jgi:hypothetical protein
MAQDPPACPRPVKRGDGIGQEDRLPQLNGFDGRNLACGWSYRMVAWHGTVESVRLTWPVTKQSSDPLLITPTGMHS